MSTILEVEKLALELTEPERATLAANLLESLPDVLSDDNEGVLEALRRDAEIEADPAKAISLAKLDSQISGPAWLMRLEFHSQVGSDILRIMNYYEGVAGRQLADEFYSELRFFCQKAANSPEAYDVSEQGLRRVNLERFPYHFLFRLLKDTVRILVVRHHRRRPSLGLHRR